MADIQSAAAEIRRGKKEEEERKKERTNHSMKIYMVSLFHRATIKNCSMVVTEKIIWCAHLTIFCWQAQGQVLLSSKSFTYLQISCGWYIQPCYCLFYPINCLPTAVRQIHTQTFGLSYWIQHQAKFPLLAAVAQDFCLHLRHRPMWKQSFMCVVT